MSNVVHATPFVENGMSSARGTSDVMTRLIWKRGSRRQ